MPKHTATAARVDSRRITLWNAVDGVSDSPVFTAVIDTLSDMSDGEFDIDPTRDRVWGAKEALAILAAADRVGLRNEVVTRARRSGDSRPLHRVDSDYRRFVGLVRALANVTR